MQATPPAAAILTRKVAHNRTGTAHTHTSRGLARHRGK